MRPQIIAGIDIGNANTKTVICEINPETMRPHVLGVGLSPSSGIRKGTVVDMDEAIHSVGESVRQAESMSGVKLKEAYVSINGTHIRSQISRGVIAVSRADNEISQHDIDRVIEAASTVSLPQNREKIHVIPRSFVIDGQEHVKSPLGMKGVRVEADTLIIDGLTPYIHNLAKCVNENDIAVAEFVYSPFAASMAVLDKSQKEHGVLNLDFGGGVSLVSFFYEGDLVHTAVLPIGSRHITNDLAIALRTSMENAERAKIEHGYIGSQKAGKKEQVDLSELIGEDDFIVAKKEIGKVVEARVDDLLDMLNTEVKKVGHISSIPAGLVISGGGANLPGLVPLLKERLKLPVRLGVYSRFDGMADQMKDLSFAVPAGLILWGIEREMSGTQNRRVSFGSDNFFKKVGDWLKNFLP